MNTQWYTAVLGRALVALGAGTLSGWAVFVAISRTLLPWVFKP